MRYKKRPLGKRMKPAPAAKKKVATSKPKKSGSTAQYLYTYTSLCAFTLAIFGYMYFYQVDIIDENKITAVHNCIITEPVKRKHTSGKNRTYYYVFKFNGIDLEYRFYDTYYNYSSAATLIDQLKVGDTVSIQVDKEDLYLLPPNYSTGGLKIVGVGRYNTFWVNHKYRNAQIEEMHKNCFYVCLTVFVGLVGTILLRWALKTRTGVKGRLGI